MVRIQERCGSGGRFRFGLRGEVGNSSAVWTREPEVVGRSRRGLIARKTLGKIFG